MRVERSLPGGVTIKRKIGLSLSFLAVLVFSLLQTGCVGENGAGVGERTIAPSTVGDSSIEGRIQQLTEHIRLSPKNWESYYNRSLLWYETGNTQRAMEDISKSIDLYVKNPDAYHLRGFYLYVQNKDNEALMDFKRAIENGSLNPETFYTVGQIHFFRKEYDLAEDAYTEAVKLDTMQPLYQFALGFMAQERGRTNRAIEHFDEALKRDPTFIKALSALHDIHLNETKDPDLAYFYNDRILVVDSTHPVARFNQGNFFFQRANVITDQAKLPEFQVLLKLAVSEYSTALQRDPNFVNAYYNRGYSYYLMEQYGRALNDFSTVISLDPFNEKAFFMKGSIQEYQGDLAGALSNYQQAEKINPDFKAATNAVKELSTKVQAGKGTEGGNPGG